MTEEETLEESCDSMIAVGTTVAKVGDILKALPDKQAARRVLVAAGLVAGIYDVDRNWRIVRQEEDDE